MGVCKITQDIIVDCDTPIVPGVDDRIIVMNKQDILSFVEDGANDSLVTALSMKVGERAFQYIGKNNSNEPTTALEKTRYNESYNHEVRFKVFVSDETVKKELEALAKNKSVVIVKNNDGTYDIYGLDQGLVVKENNQNKSDVETGGAYDVLLGSDDNIGKEPKLPRTFFDTDQATTDAAIETLLQIA